MTDVDIIDKLGLEVLQMLEDEDLSGWSSAHDALVIQAVTAYLKNAALLEDLRARCAASAYIDAKNMMRSGMVRDRILALPLVSDGSGLPQTKAEEFARIKGRSA